MPLLLVFGLTWIEIRCKSLDRLAAIDRLHGVLGLKPGTMWEELA